MEDIRLTALARYEASSDEVKLLASNIFKKLDKDEDGKVKVGEFLEFLEQGGYGSIEPSFIGEIGKDQHGLLDFEEAVVVVYLVNKKKQGDSEHVHQASFEDPELAEMVAKLKDHEKKSAGPEPFGCIIVRCSIM